MILVKFDPPIAGNVTVPGHTDWIEFNSFQFGIGRGVAAGAGGKTRDTSMPSVSEVVLTKPMDKTSTDLYAQSLFGKGMTTATIHFVNTSGDGAAPQTYLEYVLTSPLVSGYSVSSGGDRPSESISINFTKIKMLYTDFVEGKTPEAGNAKTWDLMSNSMA